jgi:hypothetical protein
LLAVKVKPINIQFNESRAVSDNVSIGDLVNVSEGRFQHEEFIEAEL